MLLNYEDVVVLPVGLQPTVCGFGRRRFLRLSYGSRKRNPQREFPRGWAFARAGFEPATGSSRNQPYPECLFKAR